MTTGRRRASIILPTAYATQLSLSLSLSLSLPLPVTYVLLTLVVSTQLWGKVVIFGGWNGERCFNDLAAFDVSTNKWSLVAATGNAPSPRYAHRAHVINGNLYIVGGSDENGQMLRDVYAFDIARKHWSECLLTSEHPRVIGMLLSLSLSCLCMFLSFLTAEGMRL